VDISPITSQLVEILRHFLWYFISILIFAVLALFFKSAWFKGKMGEFVINYSAKLLLDKKRYHLIKNVTLPTEDGTTQIDHIIVSIFGVFVIETKNMKGWIFGDQNGKMWTQKISNYSYQFQNPLHQNYKHVKILQSLLGLRDQQIHSLIVFVGDSVFKTKLPDNVTYGKGYIKYIKSKTAAVLTEAETKEIARKIEETRFEPSCKTDRQHVRHLQDKHMFRRKSSKTPLSRIFWLVAALCLMAIPVVITVNSIEKLFSTLGEIFTLLTKQSGKSPHATQPAPQQKPEQTQIPLGPTNFFSYKIALKSGREIAAREATRDGEWVKIVTTTGLYMEIPWADVDYMLKTSR